MAEANSENNEAKIAQDITNDDSKNKDESLDKENDAILTLDKKILKDFPDEQVKLSLNDIISLHDDEKSVDVINTINMLFLRNQLKKKREGHSILFFLPNAEEERIKHMSADEIDDMNDDGTEDYRNVSKLARKFRSCRYVVERNFESENGLVYSLKVSKKGKDYYIVFASLEDFFKPPDIFDKMLENDESIRVVALDEPVKLNIARRFDAFINEKYGENGYIEFKNEHSFEILTLKQFFKKTTWKSLVK